MVDMAKRDKAAADDRSLMEADRANRAEDEIKMLREQLLEANRAKDNYYSRACQLDDVKIEMERLRHVESENGTLRD